MAAAEADVGAGAKARLPLLPPDPPTPWPIAWLGRLVDWAVLSIGALMATLIFANVVIHNAFDGDIAWTTEFCELLMVWVTFMGGAAATRRGAHMVIGELIGRLHGLQRRLADAGVQVVVLVTLALLFWYGIGITQAGSFSTLTVLGWPMSRQYVALPVTAAITMVFVVWDLIEIARGKTNEQRYGVVQVH